MKNSIIDDLSWRYATKKFDAEKRLSADQIATLSQAFNLTATSYGLQPVKLVVVEDSELKQQMVPYCFGQHQPADASHVLVLCTTHVDADYVSRYFDIVREHRGTPDEILKPFEDFLRDSFTKKEKQEVADWARNQAYLIMGSLLAVCASERIDSCPMEGFQPNKIDELLELEQSGLKSVLLLPVGFRSEDDFMSREKKVRQPLEGMVRFR